MENDAMLWYIKIKDFPKNAFVIYHKVKDRKGKRKNENGKEKKKKVTELQRGTIDRLIIRAAFLQIITFIYLLFLIS